MDTFLDSSWYFLRYLDSKNTSLPCDPEKANKYMPVDLYVGGKEHGNYKILKSLYIWVHSKVGNRPVNMHIDQTSGHYWF